MLSAMKPV